MRNRDDVRSGNGIPPSRPSLPDCLANYRVMARCGNGSVALITVARSPEEAISIAEDCRDRVLAKRAVMTRAERHCQTAIAAIYLEKWAGAALEGGWEHFGPRHGGFCFVLHDRCTGRRNSRPSGLMKSGTMVEVVLLAGKTKRGGWRAQLVDQEMAGPITNWADVPPSAKPGQRVKVQVGAASKDGAHIQFHWLVGQPLGSKA